MLMFTGYNTNISHNNKIYHIQTEDNGQGNSVILTLRYPEGRIIASKKSPMLMSLMIRPLN